MLLRRFGLKAATLGAGLAIKKSLDYGFDYLLYPFALIWLGYVWGGVVMTALSIVLNLAVIRAYDWSKRDWLLLETIKEFKEGPNGSAARPLVRWLMRKGDVAAFFVLSWVEDPIVVTLYLRSGAHQYKGLERRDWMIFWASTLVSNLFWILSLVSLIELFGLVSQQFGLIATQALGGIPFSIRHTLRGCGGVGRYLASPSPTRYSKCHGKRQPPVALNGYWRSRPSVAAFEAGGSRAPPRERL